MKPGCTGARRPVVPLIHMCCLGREGKMMCIKESMMVQDKMAWDRSKLRDTTLQPLTQRRHTTHNFGQKYGQEKRITREKQENRRTNTIPPFKRWAVAEATMYELIWQGTAKMYIGYKTNLFFET